MTATPPIITLTSDFGTRDHYAGALRGAILAVNPRAVIADITHQVPAFDIAGGAYVLGMACGVFPPGTIHVVVVDPGVGSARQPVLVETGRFIFVGPDNGVFGLVARMERIVKVRRLENPRTFRAAVSATFHGRDVFGPVAGHLSLGVDVSEFGPEVDGPVTLDLFKTVVTPRSITSSIVHIDHYGNAVTGITCEDAARLAGEAGRRHLKIARRTIRGLSRTYADGPRGRPIMLFGSSGLLEIALNQGSIARRWRLRVGQRVVLV
jgi:S-adenosylmethionine hydrolase